MEGIRILITGAGRGVGHALARHALERGAIVGVNYLRSREGAEKLLELGGDRAVIVPFDVRDPDAVEAGVSRFNEEAGGVDCLVNNAGIQAVGPFVRFDSQTIRELFEVNLLGAIYCSRAVVNIMRKGKRGGRILNISSVASERPQPGQTLYAASKGGLEAFGRALGAEAARWNVQVLNIVLGPVATGLYHRLSEKAIEETEKRMVLGPAPDPALVAERIFTLGMAEHVLTTGASFRLDMGYSIG